MPDREADLAAGGNRLSLVYAGGMAGSGTLLLGDYSASLEGWRDLFQVLGDLYLHSFPELRRIPGANLLRIEIVAEESGSYEAVIAFFFGAAANGIIGNQANDAFRWTFRQMVKWYGYAIGGYVRAKSDSTDVEAIAAALERMTRERGISLDAEDLSQEEKALFDSAVDRDLIDGELREVSPGVNKAWVLAERMDHSLKNATSPLDHSCERMTVERAGEPTLMDFGPAERAVIVAPLTLPPPRRDWTSARIKFERINRKTGRALFYFASEVNTGCGAHFSRIIDLSFHRPHNKYTEAFNNDELLDVWVRQAKAERGHLNLQWEIQAANPDQGLLFNAPPAEGK